MGRAGGNGSSGGGFLWFAFDLGKLDEHLAFLGSRVEVGLSAGAVHVALFQELRIRAHGIQYHTIHNIVLSLSLPFCKRRYLVSLFLFRLRFW